MTHKFKEFNEGGFKFVPATEQAEYFPVAGTNGIRFYMEKEDEFIGFFDLFLNPGKEESIWRIIEGGKKLWLPATRESLNAIKAEQGVIDQETAEKAAKAALKQHFESEFGSSWKWFTRKLTRHPMGQDQDKTECQY